MFSAEFFMHFPYALNASGRVQVSDRTTFQTLLQTPRHALHLDCTVGPSTLHYLRGWHVLRVEMVRDLDVLSFLVDRNLWIKSISLLKLEYGMYKEELTIVVFY